jgi:hypothetical protein
MAIGGASALAGLMVLVGVVLLVRRLVAVHGKVRKVWAQPVIGHLRGASAIVEQVQAQGWELEALLARASVALEMIAAAFTTLREALDVSARVREYRASAAHASPVQNPDN